MYGHDGTVAAVFHRLRTGYMSYSANGRSPGACDFYDIFRQTLGKHDPDIMRAVSHRTPDLDEPEKPPMEHAQHHLYSLTKITVGF